MRHVREGTAGKGGKLVGKLLVCSAGQVSWRRAISRHRRFGKLVVDLER